jgi:hypothetical protein
MTLDLRLERSGLSALAVSVNYYKINSLLLGGVSQNVVTGLDGQQYQILSNPVSPVKSL